MIEFAQEPLADPLRLLWDHFLDCHDQTAYLVQEPSGVYCLSSRKLAVALGILPEAMKGCDDATLFAKPGSDLCRTHQWIIDSKRSLVDELIQFRSPCCRARWMVVSKIPVYGKAGALTAIVGSYRLVVIPRDTERSLVEVADALRTFRDSLSDLHSLTSLARHANMSTTKFERRVKHVFGISTREFIIKQRLVLGKDLLRNTLQDIQVIAKSCGYCSQSAFTRQFRSSEGVTPRTYRDRENGD